MSLSPVEFRHGIDVGFLLSSTAASLQPQRCAYAVASVAEAPKIDRDRCAKAQTILRFWPPPSGGKGFPRRPYTPSFWGASAAMTPPFNFNSEENL